MQLRIKNGQLGYGSIYKLFYFGWVLGFCLFAMILMIPMMLIAAFGGTVMVNGEEASGMAAAGATAGFMVIFPVIIAIQGFMFAGLMTLGIWIYRRFRPVTVAGQEEVF